MVQNFHSSLNLLCVLAVLGSQCVGGVPVPRGNEISETLAEFMCLFNMRGSNKAQIDEGTKNVKFISGAAIPIAELALSQNPWIYLEEVVENAPYRQLYLELTEGSPGIITAIPHNLTKAKSFEPGKIDIKDLLNVTSTDLLRNPDCSSTYVRESDILFKGNFTDCRHDKVNGKYASYELIVDCDGIKFQAPGTTMEASPEYYVIKRIGNRFPFTRTRPGFKCPCDRH